MRASRKMDGCRGMHGSGTATWGGSGAGSMCGAGQVLSGEYRRCCPDKCWLPLAQLGTYMKPAPPVRSTALGLYSSAMAAGVRKALLSLASNEIGESIPTDEHDDAGEGPRDVTRAIGAGADLEEQRDTCGATRRRYHPLLSPLSHLIARLEGCAVFHHYLHTTATAATRAASTPGYWRTLPSR